MCATVMILNFHTDCSKQTDPDADPDQFHPGPYPSQYSLHGDITFALIFQKKSFALIIHLCE